LVAGIFNHLTPAPTLTTTNTAIKTWVARMMFGYWTFHSKGEVCREQIPKKANTTTSVYAGDEFTRAVAVPMRVAILRLNKVQPRFLRYVAINHIR